MGAGRSVRNDPSIMPVSLGDLFRVDAGNVILSSPQGERGRMIGTGGEADKTRHPAERVRGAAGGVARRYAVAKKRAASASRAAHDAVAGFESRMSDARATARDLLDGFDRFGEFEEGIERLSAEVEAFQELSGADLARQFEKMKEDKALDEELAALKKKLGGKQ